MGRNLNISKAVEKVELKRAALKKVFSSIFTCQCSSGNIFLYIEK